MIRKCAGVILYDFVRMIYLLTPRAILVRKDLSRLPILAIRFVVELDGSEHTLLKNIRRNICFRVSSILDFQFLNVLCVSSDRYSDN